MSKAKYSGAIIFRQKMLKRFENMLATGNYPKGWDEAYTRRNILVVQEQLDSLKRAV